MVFISPWLSEMVPFFVRFDPNNSKRRGDAPADWPKKFTSTVYYWLVVWNILYFPINIGFMSSSQLTKSYSSEGWLKTTSQSRWCFSHGISSHRSRWYTDFFPSSNSSNSHETIIDGQIPWGFYLFCYRWIAHLHEEKSTNHWWFLIAVGINDIYRWKKSLLFNGICWWLEHHLLGVSSDAIMDFPTYVPMKSIGKRYHWPGHHSTNRHDTIHTWWLTTHESFRWGPQPWFFSWDFCGGKSSTYI